MSRSRQRGGRRPAGRRAAAAWPPLPETLHEKLGLTHVLTLPVLGIPVRFSSNSAAVLEAVESSFGIWRGFRSPPGSRERRPAPITVRLILFRGDELGRGRAKLTWHFPDRRRVVFHSPGSVGMLDLDRRDVFAYITPALLNDGDHFRYGVLEALTLATVNDSNRYPLHAAGLVRHGTVLLLAGPSGSGKSTLVYAAMSAGLDVLADDSVYVQTRPEFRVWGAPGSLYLRPDTRRHFAELSALKSAVLSNGKTKLAVPVDRERAVPMSVPAPRVGVVLLARAGGPVSLKTASPRTIESALARDLSLAFARHGSNMQTAIRALAAPGGWRLTLSPRPAEALPFLERIFDQLDRRRLSV